MAKTLSLFDEFAFNVPPTEGIKYAGSKLKLIPHILQLAKKVDAKTILDGFSGTTRVSQAFAKLGYTVICNDIAPWSEVLGTCYLLNTKQPSEYQPLIDYLNGVSPIDGWFTEHYGGHVNDGYAIQADGLKKPWQLHNTRKLDAIREEIENLNLDTVDKAVALTSLILGLDRVDSRHKNSWGTIPPISKIGLRVPIKNLLFKCQKFLHQKATTKFTGPTSLI